MVIVHKIGGFLFDLFPKAKAFGNSIDILKEELEEYYSFGPYRPKISINSEFVEVLIDVPAIINQKPEFDKAIVFCERQRFSEAKKILENLIKENPTVSEYHRVLGQIHSDEGNQEEAINCLIDALKWNPKNGFALLMMGNIFTKFKDDIDTACKYYNEAITQNPNDFISIANLGTNLIQLGKWEEGLKYLEAAYAINPDYPNSNYGIALCNEKLGNTLIAFEYAISALKKCGQHDKDLFNHSLALAIKTAEQWIKTEIGSLSKKSSRSTKMENEESYSTYHYAEKQNRFKAFIDLGFFWWNNDEVYLGTHIWLTISEKYKETENIFKLLKKYLRGWVIEVHENGYSIGRYKEVAKFIIDEEEQIPEMVSFLKKCIDELALVKKIDQRIFKTY